MQAAGDKPDSYWRAGETGGVKIIYRERWNPHWRWGTGKSTPEQGLVSPVGSFAFHLGAKPSRGGTKYESMCMCVCCLYITIAQQLQLIYVRNLRCTPNVPQRGSETCHIALLCVKWTHTQTQKGLHLYSLGLQLNNVCKPISWSLWIVKEYMPAKERKKERCEYVSL